MQQGLFQPGIIDHPCHAEGCERKVPPRILMCRMHWREVPRQLQSLVWREYVEGQEIRKDPSAGYLVIQQLAVRAIAVLEGRSTRAVDVFLRRALSSYDDLPSDVESLAVSVLPAPSDRVLVGDLWNLRQRDPRNPDWVVIPTNIGWRADGAAVMGRGLANQARMRHPHLAGWYGSWCRWFGASTPVLPHAETRTLFFPTKPLDEHAPHLSWRAPASIQQIERSLVSLTSGLRRFIGSEDVLLPLVGCGYGALSTDTVLPMLVDVVERHPSIRLVSMNRDPVEHLL